MRERPRTAEPSQILSGWKEIADYLGKGVRTVQRYERQMGLPVRRPAGKPWGSVIATRAELDGWVKASPIRETYHLANPVPEYVYPPSEIRAGVAEMLRLREQMFALRAELRKSIQTLHNSLHELHEGLCSDASSNRQRHDSSPLYSRDERKSLDSTELELLNAPTRYPKAS